MCITRNMPSLTINTLPHRNPRSNNLEVSSPTSSTVSTTSMSPTIYGNNQITASFSNNIECFPDSLIKNNIKNLKLKIIEIEKSYATIGNIIKILNAYKEKYEQQNLKTHSTTKQNLIKLIKLFQSISKKTQKNNDIAENTIGGEKTDIDIIEKTNKDIKKFELMKSEFKEELKSLKNQTTTEYKNILLQQGSTEIFNDNLSIYTDNVTKAVEYVEYLKDASENDNEISDEKLKNWAIISVISVVGVIIDGLFACGIICLSQLCASIIASLLAVVIAILDRKEIINDKEQNVSSKLANEFEKNLNILENSIQSLCMHAYSDHHTSLTMETFRHMQQTKDNEFRERLLFLSILEQSGTENNPMHSKNGQQKKIKFYEESLKNTTFYSSNTAQKFNSFSIENSYFMDQQYSAQRTLAQQ